MKAKEIRQRFWEFFEKKAHKIVDSAPIVSKDDPTLMFTNAGMNQFKDFFLGHKTAEQKRVANTQKCLRVSGKHNDLEEVGKDSYHHTMFEMLGNWSFGDYFKKEAIQWAWEFLTVDMGIDGDALYATYFGGDKSEKLASDEEAHKHWLKWLPEDRILDFGKKDNFWEMGETGPCGPCSEIHIDLRSEDDKAHQKGSDLVNKGHPEVIEIWNLVFIQYNRKSSRALEELPEKHVDTGMGFERLCMVLQAKSSSYETDIFSPLINLVEKKSGLPYKNSYESDAWSDIAMRVIVDHIRAVCFTIADGEIPGNTGAGYVIRRILRRAVRYYYSFLNIHEPFMYKLVEPLGQMFDEIFPELLSQREFISNVILQEEKSFLRTLKEGLKRFENLPVKNGTIDGASAFELYDTYGFPIDLTRLIAREKGWKVDKQGFEEALRKQQERSRADAKKSTGDWVILTPGSESRFLGYDQLHVPDARVLRYRTVKEKGKPQYQLVLDRTPFYPEGGGQIGDNGFLYFGNERVKVIDTIKENELIIHIVDRIPENIAGRVKAEVKKKKRQLTENNHTATHLLHAALRKVLGDHVQQKGSLVAHDHLRFDFSHFQKMSDEELDKVEHLVNAKIRENIPREEQKRVPIEKAREAGAMMLFGEKYGDEVRMISFDPDYSVELCGGCHVPSTGHIGYFKILSETGIAAGVRRIEAVTADQAEKFIEEELDELNAVREMFKKPKKVSQKVMELIEKNKMLSKRIEQMYNRQASDIQSRLKEEFEEIKGINFMAKKIPVPDSKAAKTIAYNLEKEVGNAFILLAREEKGRPQLLLAISQNLVDEKGLHAGKILSKLAKNIKGGGGGQSFFAEAGGKDPEGISKVLEEAKSFL